MLTISKKIVDELYSHGQKAAPIEACGYLAGKDNRVVKYYPMTNVDRSEDHFTLDPNEQFGVVKAARKDGLDIIAVYHTHPVSPARPSSEDVKLAYDPNIGYVILSLIDNSIKLFKIKNGVVENQDLEVV